MDRGFVYLVPTRLVIVLLKVLLDWILLRPRGYTRQSGLLPFLLFHPPEPPRHRCQDEHAGGGAYRNASRRPS